MTNSLPPELLKKLQSEYIASFGQKIDELVEARSKRDLDRLQQLLHKLAGSGKTYSFEKLSDLARAGELYLSENSKADETFDNYFSAVLDILQNVKSETSQKSAQTSR